jgi:hypothetical protein
MGKTFTRQKTRDFDRDDLQFEKRKHKKNASSGGSKRMKTLNRVVEYEDFELEYDTNTKYVNTK